VCLTRGDQAVLSPHVGDLDTAESHHFFVEMIEKLAQLLDVTPEIVAHDLHPDYRSTRWALEQLRAREPVQHHHAHIASCLVDNARAEPVIGVAFDGSGCGPDGDAWGGEILVCDLRGFTRVAHLGSIALPGGAAAIREPWRLALAALLDAGLPPARLPHIPPLRRAAVAGLVERAPRATGAGRWFDAVAALCRVCDVASYEGQAAVELEALARRDDGDAHPYPYELLDVDDAGELFDLRPMVRALCAELDADVAPARAAARFHATLSAVVVDGARRARARTGLECVALSGGCFQNRILTETCKAWLEADGFEVLLHRRVPPNDGGVALGQAAVAAHRWASRSLPPGESSPRIC
jgi:hydrogenase maturation protein HypF